MIEKSCWILSELLEAEFPETFWYVDRLLAPGLTLLWGSAKSGKSILITQALLAISTGCLMLGKFSTQKAQTLYISLEDGPRRLQRRLKAAGARPQSDFIVFTDWQRGQKGVDALEKYLDINPGIKIVCIDTLVLFSQITDFNDYAKMSNFMSALKRIADQREICIITIHHSKKTGHVFSGEITETALGSTGIVAGPDHLLFLKRTPGSTSDAHLYYISKDAEPLKMGLNFNSDISGWVYAGEVEEQAESLEQKEILELLRNQGPLTTNEIWKQVDSEKTKQAVSNMLSRLLKNGRIKKVSYGVYDYIKGEAEQPLLQELPIF